MINWVEDCVKCEHWAAPLSEVAVLLEAVIYLPYLKVFWHGI